MNYETWFKELEKLLESEKFTCKQLWEAMAKKGYKKSYPTVWRITLGYRKPDMDESTLIMQEALRLNNAS